VGSQRSPAAVIGYEICNGHCPEILGREGAEIRVILESENLAIYLSYIELRRATV